ncbi:polynucleotide kinase [Vibrio phage Vc1]|uniref:Polynucleotide kinase n=1 Tax=Vibrio phage Vc1 TaxID=1480731 RepID=A0A6M5CCW2_9CAUD|nr:polynucleotide kinase [Vibrio virus 2019VC1]
MESLNLWDRKYSLETPKGLVILDYDGTLSDGTHGLHLLPTVDLHLTESWSEFNRAAVKDTPFSSTIAVVNSLWVAGHAIIILTGRSDEVEGESYARLKHNGVKFDFMIMRRASDNRKDTVIKEEVLRAIGPDNIVCAFDDSPNVIRHFRNPGITTYAVTEYDKPHSHLQIQRVHQF